MPLETSTEIHAVSWGYESRLASVRVISPPLAAPKATRLEVRVPGADVCCLLQRWHIWLTDLWQMNAHYAFSAVFALGLHGIKNKLELNIPPTSQIKPADHAATYDRLPKDLFEATQRFKAKDSLARKCVAEPLNIFRRSLTLGSLF